MGLFHLIAQNLNISRVRNGRHGYVCTQSSVRTQRWRLERCILLAVICLLSLHLGSVHAAPSVQTDSPLATPVEPSAAEEAGQEAPAQDTPAEESAAPESMRRENTGLVTGRTTSLSVDLGLVLVVAVLTVVVLVAGYQTWQRQ